MTARRLPYPGLRAFRREEADLFFGRDDEIDVIVERLTENRFLGVLGASGSGKSSLVRTGLLEALEGGFSSAGSAWRIVICTPGGDPIGNLARALAGKDGDAEALEKKLRRGPRSIVEWCEEGGLAEGCSLLLLVDQFEELFNYPGAQAGEDAHALAGLLVESAASPRAPIYVVLTMRSDYFGACGAFPILAEAIGRSLFLTPRMLREACREAIACPAAVVGFEIKDDLLATLLNDMERFASFAGEGGEGGRAGREADQLPLMQYALNRMWRQAAGGDDGGVVLTTKAYGEIGGLEGALDQHGEEVLAAVGVHEETVERVFRTLVRGPTVNQAVRDPHRIGEIAAISGLPVDQVIRVVGVFAGEDCQFLRANTPLGPSTYVDISHESLIRQWKKLSAWLTREALAVDTWRMLESGALAWDGHERASDYLPGGRQLRDRRAWLDQTRPTAAWVRRSQQDADRDPGQGLVLVEAYLAAGEAREAAELAAREAREAAEVQARRRRKRMVQLAAGVAILAVLAGLGSVAWSTREQELAKRDATLEREQNRLKGLQVQQQFARERAERQQAEIERQAADLKKQREELALRTRLTAQAQAGQRAAQAGQRAAEAAKQVSYILLGQLIKRVEDDQDRVDASSTTTLADTQQLQDMLPSDGSWADNVDGRQRRRLALISARAAAAAAGLNLPPAKAAEIMKANSELLDGAGREDAAAAALWRGRAAELSANTALDFKAARENYEQALDGSTPPRGGERDAARLEAAAAIVALDRRLGATPEGERAADWCLGARGKVADGDPAFLPLQTCLAAVAERWINEERESAEASELLKAMAAEWALDGDSEAPPEKSLAKLRLKIEIQRLQDYQDSSIDVDAVLIDQGRKHFAANPGSEFASNLVAGATETTEDDDEPFAARIAFLQSTETSTGYLMDSVFLLRRRRHLGEEHEQSEVPDVTTDRKSDKALAGWLESEFPPLTDVVARVVVLDRLEKRGAPPEPASHYLSEPDRRAVLQTLEPLATARLKRFAMVLQRTATANDLATDLQGDQSQVKLRGQTNDLYLDDADLTQVETVKQAWTGYDALCQQASLCGDEWRRTEILTTSFQKLGGRNTAARPATANVEFHGYDLVSYRRGRAARGRWSLAWPSEKDPRLLFSTPENLAAFTRSSQDYQPAYGGEAADYRALGDRGAGQPRLYCVLGDRLLFFATQAGRDQWCLPGRGAELEKKIASFGPGGLGPRQPPVSGPFSSSGELRAYPLTGAPAIVAPRGGVVTVAGRVITIRHADDTVSRLGLVGAAFAPRSGWIASGEPLAYTPEATGSQRLTWRVNCPSGPQANLDLFLKGADSCAKAKP